MKQYEELRKQVLERLENELPDSLHYHSINHTMEVLEVCEEYIDRLDIPPYEANLLRVGALLHDIGFTVSSVDHEERGTEIAQDMMGELGYSEQDIKVVQGLIMATKIPQNPKNDLENIICDADLDYLGKDNYYEISNKLFRELKEGGVIESDEQWHQIQIKFLEAHEYHTDFARLHRQAVKEERLAELKAENPSS
jgi:putative nucleotidyltransferase with HDIG domain